MRLAVPDDLAHLNAISLDADQRFVALGRPEFVDPDGIPDAVAQRAQAEARLLVAALEPQGEAPGVPVGWVYVGRLDGELCVGQISVLRAYGRQGVGSRLLQATLERARAAGEPSVVLNTDDHVPWGRAWYERNGFVVVPPEQWSVAMRRVVDEQVASGLEGASRVHLRLRF